MLFLAYKWTLSWSFCKRGAAGQYCYRNVHVWRRKMESSEKFCLGFGVQFGFIRQQNPLERFSICRGFSTSGLRLGRTREINRRPLWRPWGLCWNEFRHNKRKDLSGFEPRISSLRCYSQWIKALNYRDRRCKQLNFCNFFHFYNSKTLSKFNKIFGFLDCQIRYF